MVRLTGLQVSNKIIVAPKSGFRVRMLVFQTPHTMSELLGSDVDDNHHMVATDKHIQGYFESNGQHLTTIVKDQNGIIRQAFINDQFNSLFDNQIRLMDDKSFHDQLMTMRITRSNVHILSDRRRFFTNKGKEARTYRWSVFRKLFTTVKFPPLLHGSHIDVTDGEFEMPDRKIFVMFIVTPAKENIRYPEGLKFSTDHIRTVTVDDEDPTDMVFDDNNKPFDPKVRTHRVSQEPRQGSVFDPEDFEGRAGPSMPKLPEGQSEVEKVEEISDRGTPAPSRDSKGKFVARAPSAPADELREAFKQALKENREEARAERAKSKAVMDVDPDGGQLPEGMADMTDRWADEQGILLQPTIKTWWREMPKGMLNIKRPSARRFRR